MLGALADRDVEGEIVRVAALDVHPGVTSEAQGTGDDWPALRERILAADIVLLGSPIWLGNPSSVCRRVLERMDAFLGETDDEGRMLTFGRVGEAMGKVDYADLEQIPAAVAATTRMMATNLAHVARLLRATPYPPPG